MDHGSDPFAYTKKKTYASCQCVDSDVDGNRICKWQFNKDKEKVQNILSTYRIIRLKFVKNKYF